MFLNAKLRQKYNGCSGHPNKKGTNRKCPDEDTGKNSVRPCVKPNTID